MKTKLPTPQKLPSGMYRCQVMVEGKRVSVVDPDPDVCQAKAVAVKTGIIENKAKQKSAITLDGAILEYMEIRTNVLSPSTIRGYENMRKHRFARLMPKKLYTITRKDIQAAVNEEAKKVSPKTVANAYGLLRPVFKDNDIDISGVKLPQKIGKKVSYLSAEDIAKLIDVSIGDTCELPIVMAVWLGMRRSEIIGLCWDCVDFQNNTVEIRRAMVPDKNNKWILKEGAKNESSQRTIKCPSYIMTKLKDMYKGQNGQIFSMSPETVRKHLHIICRKAGIPDTTVHGLRHSNAAVMVALNITDKYAMARGGWSTEHTFKQIYAYVFPEGADEADDLVNKFFESMIAHEIAHE